jgi:hypothetical protein
MCIKVLQKPSSERNNDDIDILFLTLGTSKLLQIYEDPLKAQLLKKFKFVSLSKNSTVFKIGKMP